MAGFNPALYALSTYNQPLIPRPVKLCSTQHHQSQILPVVINFTTVAPTFALQINLNQGTPGQLLTGGIQGVYVDNSNNGSGLILIFPDTQYQIEVAAFTSKFVPVFSNTNICLVYNSALANTLLIGNTITLIFTNFLVNSFDTSKLSQSANLSLVTDDNAGNIQFAPTVEGINHIDANYDMSVTGVGVLLAAPPILAGVYVITHLKIAISAAYVTGGAQRLTVGLRLDAAGVKITTDTVWLNSDDRFLGHTILRNTDNEVLIFQAPNFTVFAYWDASIPGSLLEISADYLWTTAQIASTIH